PCLLTRRASFGVALSAIVLPDEEICEDGETLPTAGSLDSHQPRKASRHGHGRRFVTGPQEVAGAPRLEGRDPAAGDPHGRRLRPARRPDVLPAGGRGRPLRGPAPRPDQPLPGPATMAPA